MKAQGIIVSPDFACGRNQSIWEISVGFISFIRSQGVALGFHRAAPSGRKRDKRQTANIILFMRPV